MIGSVTSIPFDPIAAGITRPGQRTAENRENTALPGQQSGSEKDTAQASQAIGSTQLTEEEQKEVEKLKKRDREVRQHEQAHIRAAGNLALGGPQYSYTTGPDGRRYVTDGSVSIDTSKEAEPKENIRKGDRIVKAALAPAEPSPQDLEVAAKGRQMKLEALSELRTQRQEEMSSKNESSEAQPATGSTGNNDAQTRPTTDIPSAPSSSPSSPTSGIGPNLDQVRNIYEGVANNGASFSPVSRLQALVIG